MGFADNYIECSCYMNGTDCRHCCYEHKLHWERYKEAVTIYMRREGLAASYEVCKDIFNACRVTKAERRKLNASSEYEKWWKRTWRDIFGCDDVLGWKGYDEAYD